MNVRRRYASSALVFFVTLSFALTTRADPPRGPFVRSLGATREGFMFRPREGSDVTCERRADGAVRCIDRRVRSVLAARRAIGHGMWALVLGGGMDFAAWLEGFACRGEECSHPTHRRVLLIAGTVLDVAGVAALAAGGVLAHRFHAAERRLRRETFTLAPMVDGEGNRAPSGVVFRASF